MNFTIDARLAALLIVGIFSFILLPKARGQDSLLVIDLSESHEFEILERAGIQFQKNESGRSFHLLPQPIKIVLPAGVEIGQTIDLGSGSIDDTGNLKTLSFHGGILPTEEAFTIAEKAHLALGIETSDLEIWLEANKYAGRDAKPYINGGRQRYPSATIEVRPSFNKLYPWSISLSFGWNLLEKNQNRDELWGEIHNPKPPLEYASISLDPVNAGRYRREDAYRGFRGPFGYFNIMVTATFVALTGLWFWSRRKGSSDTRAS